MALKLQHTYRSSWPIRITSWEAPGSHNITRSSLYWADVVFIALIDLDTENGVEFLHLIQTKNDTERCLTKRCLAYPTLICEPLSFAEYCEFIEQEVFKVGKDAHSAL